MHRINPAVCTKKFGFIFNDERFFNIPKILETPIKGGPEDYLPDIKTILSLLDPVNIKVIKNTKFEQCL